jgi:hypothetical protein
MTLILSSILVLLLASEALAGAPTEYKVSFSTYLGGTDFDAIRDVAVDSKGNIVVVGGTASRDFPATPDAFQTALQRSTGDETASRLGDTDAFIAKYSPAGELLWCTYLGGPGYDRAYAVEVDKQDRIIVAGRAGPGFPTTPGAFQPNFIDTFAPIRSPGNVEYGKQNGFVACFTASGARVWASYVWYGELCRDVAVDDDGDVYLPSVWNGNIYAPNSAPPDLSGFRKRPSLPLVMGENHKSAGGDTCLLKVKSDGSRILWGTWLCGSGEEEGAAVVRLDAQRNVYFLVSTASKDMPTNPADQGIHTHAEDHGEKDMWMGKISPDGNELQYGTYIGGNAYDGIDTHQLAVDAEGNAYAAFSTASTNMPTTAGALQSSFPAGHKKAPIYACKVGPLGKLLFGTYLADTGSGQVEGLSVDREGNVYITGTTHTRDFPLAGTPLQSTAGEETSDFLAAGVTAAGSGFFTILSADFRSLVYSTYFGKGSCLLHYEADGTVKHFNAYGGFHANLIAPDGSFLAVGSWLSDGLPLVNAGRSSFRGGPGNSPSNFVKHSDGTLTRLVPTGIGRGARAH